MHVFAAGFLLAAASLRQTVTDLDTAVFRAYNTCDLAAFESYFDPAVEFYHDQGGVTRGAATLTAQVKANICGKVRRELVSHEVYPLQGFGAVQTGVHRFLHPNDPQAPDGLAKFVHLWELRDGKWRITRVISYDHVSVKR